MCTVALTQGGSSPRVRGKEEVAALPVSSKGIIPAGAGKRLAPPALRLD